MTSHNTVHAGTAHGSPSVLLVSDNQSSLEALVLVLDGPGFRLVCASSQAEALGLLARERFAAAIVDVNVPVMDGLETARRMRELPSGRSLPMLVLTPAHGAEEAERGSPLAADHISKPFLPDKVRARIQNYVESFVRADEAQRRLVERDASQFDELHRRLDAFERIASAAIDTDDPDEFLHSLLRVFVGAADSADNVTLLLRQEQMLVVRASIGLPAEASEDVEVPMGLGFAGRIAATGRPQLLIGDAIGATVYGAWLQGRGLRALYGVPLAYDGEVIGVAHIGSTRADAFSKSDLSLFGAMVDRAGRVVSRQHARRRLYDILDAAPVSIAIFRAPTYRCEFVNRAHRNSYGGRGALGLPTAALGIPPEMLALFSQVIASGEALTIDEYALEADWKGGGTTSKRFLQLSLHPLRDALGRPESVLWCAVDMTAQVGARRVLEQAQRDRAHLLEIERGARQKAEIANRMKDEFLATVSHELRTPLGAILGWTVNARRGVVDDVDRALAAIERSARAQARIIDDILDMSRIVRGGLRLEVDATNLASVLRAAAEAVRPAADAKKIALDVEVSSELGVVAADGERIQQVTWNLLSNAVKFTAGGGHVRMVAERKDETVQVRVTDTGAGIDAVLLPYVFQPFWQADASIGRRHGGVGLGLAIAKEIVQAHGGTISAASDGPGTGTTFTFELPARPPAAEGPRRQGRSGHRPRKAAALTALAGLRVLVVDDELDFRELVGGVLRHHGAQVRLASTATEALSHIGVFHPSVIVSDIGMPEVDGYALLRQLRALPAEMGGQTPALAVTAYAGPENRLRAAAAGYQDHIAKPVDPFELIARIAHLGRRGPPS